MAAVANKVVKQLAGSGTGQSLKDRVQAASYSLAGSALGKSVCKATTEEIAAPKKKHVDFLIQSSHEPNVSIPSLADHLLKRLNDPNWVVVFKSLITIHNVINFGNERFSQYLASGNFQISLPGYTDRSGSQSYDMSELIRQYSKYIHEKTNTYRLMAFDFCKIKRGKDDGVLRTMAVPKLLKTLPVLQTQMDILLEFETTPQQMSNPIVKSAFMLLYKDMIRLFASYNEGMINLIEKYFSMKRKQCKHSLALYKGFIQRMDKVSEFVTIAEGIGCGDKESLGLQPVPDKVVKALEQHLASLEKKKKLTSAHSSDSASSLPGSPASEVSSDKTVAASKDTPQPAPSNQTSASQSNQTAANTMRAPSPAPPRPSSPAPPRPVSPVPLRPNEGPQPKLATPTESSEPPKSKSTDVSPPAAAVKIQQKASNITLSVTPTNQTSSHHESSNDLFDLVDFGSHGNMDASVPGNNSFNPFATIEDPPDDDLDLPAECPATTRDSSVAPQDAGNGAAAESDMWLDHQEISGGQLESFASVAAAMVSNHAGDLSGAEDDHEAGKDSREDHESQPAVAEHKEESANQDSVPAEPAQLGSDAVADLFDFFGGPVDPSPAASATQVPPSSNAAAINKASQPPQQKSSSALDDILSLDPFSSNFVNLPEEKQSKSAAVDPLEKLKLVSGNNVVPAASPLRRNQPQKNLLDTDLDSTLASLAGSLSVSPSKTKWAQPNQPTKLTGGSSYSAGVSAGSTIPWNANKDSKPPEETKSNDPFGDLLG